MLLFSVTSINITFYLKKYFHLANYLNFKLDKKVICPRKVLKTFCYVSLLDVDFFTKIHNMITNKIINYFIELTKK